MKVHFKRRFALVYSLLFLNVAAVIAQDKEVDYSMLCTPAGIIKYSQEYGLYNSKLGTDPANFSTSKMMFDWIAKNIQLTPEQKSFAGKNNGKDAYIVIIDEEGALIHAQYCASMAGFGPDLEPEMVRLFKLMSPWKPIMKDGVAVKSVFVFYLFNQSFRTSN
jgi:hypothetical protein